MSTTTTRRTVKPAQQRVEYEENGKRYTNSAEAWRAFRDGPAPNASIRAFDPPEEEEDDGYDEYEMFIPRDLRARAEALAEDRGTNLGDMLVDMLSVSVVSHRGAA